MNKPFKQAVREHYQTQQLGAAQLQRLKAMQTLARRPYRRNVLAFAAAAVILAAIGLSYVANRIEHGQIRQAIVEEIAANHLKNGDIKVPTASLAELRGNLDQLGFFLAEARPPHGQALRLLGGGYCSIQGRMAAQLQYQDIGAQSRATLYQVSLPQAWRFLAGKPFSAQAKGVAVTLWVSEGVLFALAAHSK